MTTAMSSATSVVIPTIPIEQVSENQENANPAYQELVCRIPADHREKIESKMASLNDFQGQLHHIQLLMKEGRYNELPEDAFYYALRGVREGLLEPKVVLRISDIETLRQQGVAFEVFDPVEKYQNEEELRDFILRATGKHLTDEKLDTFIEALKNMPQEDRFLMLFTPARQKRTTKEVKFSSDVTISQVIESRLKMNIFNRFKSPEHAGKYMRLSSSLELFETTLEVINGERRARSNPAFGKSTVEQIENNGRSSTRDVCHLYLVPDANGKNKLVTYPKADGFGCEENDFNYHDRYHLFVACSLKEEDRKLYVGIGSQLRDDALSRKSQISKANFLAQRSLGWEIIDMDFPYEFRARWGARNSKSQFHEQAKHNLELYENYPGYALIEGLFDRVLNPFGPSQKAKAMIECCEEGSLPAGMESAARLSLEELGHVFETEKDFEETLVFILKNLPENEEMKQARQKYLEEETKQLEQKMSRIQETLSYSSGQPDMDLLTDYIELLFRQKLIERVFTPDERFLSTIHSLGPLMELC